MKVMVLAAGQGKRLMPLTRTIPKPLLEIDGKSLIERHIERLVSSGFPEIVINLYHLGEQIETRLGDGRNLGAEITYVKESGLLETGGGITNALEYLGDDNFIVVSSDVYSDYDFRNLPDSLEPGLLGHLVMVDNPVHHPEGDFAISQHGRLAHDGNRLNWSGIGILSTRLFSGLQVARFPLRKLLDNAVDRGLLTGEYFSGFWLNVDTPERYEWLQSLRG
jgi:MurNAc alpha-1-phosphate uridylyltransferase